MNPFSAILYNLGHLADFRGRQRRSQFWPYAAFVIALVIAGITAVFVPMMSASMARLRTIAAENPETARDERTATSESITFSGPQPGIVPEFQLILISVGVVVVFVVLLMAAAVARRLHDRGKTAFWGLAPVGFLTIGLTLMPFLLEQVGQAQPNLTLFFALFINNALYLASLVTLLIWLAGGSTPGENRFGPAIPRA
jgi:uncharacterized membrane protein YhaH (DUF805 family)